MDKTRSGGPGFAAISVAGMDIVCTDRILGLASGQIVKKIDGLDDSRRSFLTILTLTHELGPTNLATSPELTTTGRGNLLIYGTGNDVALWRCVSSEV